MASDMLKSSPPTQSEESKASPLEKTEVSELPQKPVSKPAGGRRRWRVIIGILVLALVLVLGAPWMVHVLNYRVD